MLPIGKDNSMSSATKTTTAGAPVTEGKKALEYAEQRRAFQIHVTVASVSIALIFIVNLYTNAISGITGEIWAWWSVWVLIGWGFALMVHGILLMAVRPERPVST